MRLETFFEKFELFADMPGAVGKMRELVLELAVRGSLTERLNADRSDPTWNDFLEEFGNRIHDPKPRRSPPFDIPAEWRWVCLEDLGTTKARNAVADGTLVSFTPMALIPAGYGRSAQFEERIWGEVKKGFTHFADGDVVLAKITPCFENGKSAVMRRLINGVGAGTTELHVFRRGTNVIADAPTPANLQFLFHPSYTISPADLRKSILTLAVQGDLSVGSSDPAEWSTVTMEEVCDLITDGEHATPQRIPSGVPLATAKNVRDGFLDMAHTDYVAPETAEKCWKRCKPRHGDILMVCVGATTGRVCLVTNPPDMVLVRSVALLRPSTKRIEGTFLDLFLRSPSGQTQIWGGVRQNAQPCLYLGKMSAFTIQLPPLAEQRRIVAKVEQLMALVDALETQLTVSRRSATNLLDTVLAKIIGVGPQSVLSSELTALDQEL